MNNTFRDTVNTLAKWLLSLSVVHLLALIVYSMTCGSMITDLLSDDQFDKAFKTLFIFSVVVMILFPIYYAIMQCRDVDLRTDMKSYMKEKNFTILGYFKDRCLKMFLYRMIVFILWHIPVAVMYYAFNMAPVFTTPFGKFWAVEAGAIAFTNSVWLGILINLLIFFGTYIFCMLIGIRNLHKDIKENSFT